MEGRKDEGICQFSHTPLTLSLADRIAIRTQLTWTTFKFEMRRSSSERRLIPCL